MKPEHKAALRAKKEHWLYSEGAGGSDSPPAIVAGSKEDIKRRIENQKKYSTKR
jgi:hypothetical protein